MRPLNEVGRRIQPPLKTNIMMSGKARLVGGTISQNPVLGEATSIPPKAPSHDILNQTAEIEAGDRARTILNDTK